MDPDFPTAGRELKAVAALGRKFSRLETSSARSRRVVVLRQRRIAVLAVVIAMVSVGSVGAATGLIPVGTQHESPARDSRDSLHTVVASGSSPVAGKWRVESYRGGPVTGPTGRRAVGVSPRLVPAGPLGTRSK
jgi:hypothetical protein